MLWLKYIIFIKYKSHNNLDYLDMNIQAVARQDQFQVKGMMADISATIYVRFHAKIRYSISYTVKSKAYLK